MRIVIFICVLVGFFSQGWTGFNEDLDREKRFLNRELPQFQTERYAEDYKILTRARKDLLADLSAKKEMLNASSGDKFILLDTLEGFVVKKRVNGNIKEHFVWELSHLMGLSEFIVPSLAVEFGKKQVILQKKEFFVVGKGVDGKPHSIFLKKISLKNYWKAHIGAYLLGLGDLAGVNVGVGLHGNIRFFDNESSLKYQNEPTTNDVFFKTGFVSKSLDWPQYRKSLDKRTVESLKTFVSSLSNLEEDLQTYLDCRHLQIDEEGFAFRLDKVRSFVLEEGVSFCDFYESLYPLMSPGLDELCEIVSEITNRSIDHGSALFFASRLGKNYKLSHSQKKAMSDWMDTYIY